MGDTKECGVYTMPWNKHIFIEKNSGSNKTRTKYENSNKIAVLIIPFEHNL